jgi:hypothetical protein
VTSSGIRPPRPATAAEPVSTDAPYASRTVQEISSAVDAKPSCTGCPASKALPTTTGSMTSAGGAAVEVSTITSSNSMVPAGPSASRK